MTLTIDLTPSEERGLFEVARQNGLPPAEAAHRLLTAHLPQPGREQEEAWVQEYQALAAQERHGPLSAAQAHRLREVTAALDALEAQDPAAQEADRRIQETGDKLDEMLTLLRNLPRKNADKSAEQNKDAAK